MRGRLAYVEQETPVVPGTIRDNLLFTHPDATEDEIAGVLRAVRLDEKSTRSTTGWTRRCRRRRCPAGSGSASPWPAPCSRTPEVLLLDEATAQVDGLTEAASTTASATAPRGGAVVTIAHRLSTVSTPTGSWSWRQGRIRAQGTHDELLATDELYRDLVEALRIGVSVTG